MATARPEALLFTLFLAATAAGATELGSLFHSPEERARLDRLRRGDAEAPVQAEGKARVTGFVRRSDGRNTVWINGQPLPVADPRAAPLMDPGSVRPEGEGSVKVERSDPARVKR